MDPSALRKIHKRVYEFDKHAVNSLFYRNQGSRRKTDVFQLARKRKDQIQNYRVHEGEWVNECIDIYSVKIAFSDEVEKYFEENKDAIVANGYEIEKITREELLLFDNEMLRDGIARFIESGFSLWDLNE